MAIIAFRFVVRMQLGETAGWIAFAFLQARANKTHVVVKKMRTCML